MTFAMTKARKAAVARGINRKLLSIKLAQLYRLNEEIKALRTAIQIEDSNAPQ